MDDQSQVFFTDQQLCDRWQCSHMKLWRLREQGKLSRPIKIAGAGRNLTPASVVKEVEAPVSSRPLATGRSRRPNYASSKVAVWRGASWAAWTSASHPERQNPTKLHS